MRYLIFVLPFLIAACGGSAESLAEDHADVVDDMADVLAGIKTPEDAKAAKGKFKELAERAKKLLAELKANPPQNASDAMAMAKAMAARTGKATTRMMQEAQRIMGSPELKKAFGDAMSAMKDAR